MEEKTFKIIRCKGTYHISPDELWSMVYEEQRIIHDGVPSPDAMIVGLYKAVIARIMLAGKGYANYSWEKIRKIEGWPQVSKAWSKRMYELFGDLHEKYYTRKNTPGYLRPMAMGVWMNSGFSSSEEPPAPEDTIICDFDIQYEV